MDNSENKSVLNAILATYKTKGLNGLYAFLRKNNIAYNQQYINFGWANSKKANELKAAFLGAPKSLTNGINLHYYSVCVRCKNGYSINMLRGTKITIENPLIKQHAQDIGETGTNNNFDTTAIFGQRFDRKGNLIE